MSPVITDAPMVDVEKFEVKVPSAPVVPLAGEKVSLDMFPVSATATPATPFPSESPTVTVTASVVVPSAATVGVATTMVVVGSAGEPEVKSTFVVTVTLPMVAVTVFIPADVEDIVVRNTPLGPVVPEAGENRLSEPVAESETACPVTGFLFASCASTVTTAVELPSAGSVAGMTLMELFACDGVPPMKVTVVET